MAPTRSRLVNGRRVQLGSKAEDRLLNPIMPPRVVVAPEISAKSLVNPVPLVQIGQPKIPTTPAQFVANLAPATQQAQKGLITAQTREADQRNDVLTRILGQDTPNSQQTFDSSFKQAGGDEFLQQFTDANTRLAQLQGKFRTAAERTSGAEGQSQVFEGAQLNELSRQEAVEVGNQALLVQALQGNVETARQIALDTTRFASEDRRAELDNLIAQYNALDGIVQGQEKQLIDTQKAEAEAEKAELERTQDLIDAAITSGAASVEDMQQLTSTKLDNAAKQSLAAQIAARGAGEDRALGQEDRELDRRYKEAQIAKLEVETAEEIAAKTGGDATSLQAYGSEYAATGKLPSGSDLEKAGLTAGQVAEFAKSLPKPEGTLVDKNTGVKPSSLSAAQEDGIIAAKDMVRRLDELKQAYEDTGLLSNSAKRARYKDLSDEIVDLIARARTGAVINEEEARTYQKKIPELFGLTNLLANRPSVGKQKIDDLKASIAGKLNTALDTNGLSIYGFSKVRIGDQEHVVGEELEDASGKVRVLPDGSLHEIKSGNDTSGDLSLNRPQRNANPGNVKVGGIGDQFARKDASGRPMTDEQGHLVFASPEDGLKALKADIEAKVSGRSQAAQRILGKQAQTLAELNRVYAEDPNWKNNVARILGVSPSAPLASIPRERLIAAIMKAEGYSA